MDLRKLKFPANSFDAIWANAVLLHLKKKEIPQVIKDFYRILKLNGKLHIRVRQGKGSEIKIDKLAGNEKRLFTLFTKRELVNYLKKSKFIIIRSKIFPDETGRKKIKWVSIWAEK